MSIENNIKVSICIRTFNHESFIERCLNSVFNQKITCSYEVIIGDDSSTDATKEIVMKLISGRDNVKFITRKRNIGFSQNYFDILDKAVGNYIAYLDGDDFWLPDKLDKQINFLDRNPDFSAVSTKRALIDSKNAITFPVEQYSCFTKDNIFHVSSYPFHSSILFRHEALNILNSSCSDIGVLFNELMLYLDLLVYGPIHVIDERLAIYQADGGISYNSSQFYKIFTSLVKTLSYAEELGYNLNDIQLLKNKIFKSYAIKFLKLKDFQNFQNVAKELVLISDDMNFFYKCFFRFGLYAPGLLYLLISPVVKIKKILTF
jgi:glycosyltransferase involved in cell wall biosynthesis